MAYLESDQSIVDWAYAGRALGGCRVSGDQHVVAGFDGGVLVGLIDGLGHGPEAAEAALCAVNVLTARAAEDVLELLRNCHSSLRGTRGAVMTLASIRAGDAALTWAGVGNVDALLVRANRATKPSHETLPLRGGVVGYQLPPLRATTVTVQPGDLLVMVSDGIRSAFMSEVVASSATQDTADFILRRFAKDSDDAHVVVAKYQGSVP